MTEGPPRRFELDSGAERAVGNLRLAGAVLVGACAVWIALSDPSPLGWLAAIAATLVSVGWVVAWVRGRRRARNHGDWYLELGREALVLAEGTDRHHVPWSEVSEVEVDEDRLVVRLERRGKPAVSIQPRYRGASLHELGEAIQKAHRDASRHPGD